MKPAILILTVVVTFFVYGQTEQKTPDQGKAEKSVKKHLSSKYKKYQPLCFEKCFTSEFFALELQKKYKTKKRILYTIEHDYSIEGQEWKDRYFHLDEHYKVILETTLEEVVLLITDDWQNDGQAEDFWGKRFDLPPIDLRNPTQYKDSAQTSQKLPDWIIPAISIEGDFNGDNKKEKLMRNEINADISAQYYFSDIFFSNKNIPSIKDTGVFVCDVINEGDLDEKKGDEITVWYMSCEASEWASGVVYSLRGDKWVKLTSVSDFGFNKDVDYVKKDPNNKGQIIISTRKELPPAPLETKYVKID